MALPYLPITRLPAGAFALTVPLALIGRYGIAPIGPGSAYLAGATGPTRGARLLFDGRVDGLSARTELQRRIDLLDADLHIGMQAMEDALCNWQKSPRLFVNFTG